MTAIFGSPVAAVLLAIELLLFEFSARSAVPVALACATASAVRIWFFGSHPAFAMAPVPAPSPMILLAFIPIGAVVGVAATLVSRAVYQVEEQFERLPIHWMWWPAIGAVAVGLIGYFAPRTMGVGYNNIEDIISNRLPLQVLTWLCAMKLLSWLISLGSGTSGGTLAPLLTIGSGLGALLAAGLDRLIPGLEIPLGLAALVGMAAMFAGASHALLASVVFAFETTMQPQTLPALLAGATSAYLVSHLIARHSIMTERIARRGLVVPNSYEPDPLNQISVGCIDGNGSTDSPGHDAARGTCRAHRGQRSGRLPPAGPRWWWMRSSVLSGSSPAATSSRQLATAPVARRFSMSARGNSSWRIPMNRSRRRW